jgi:hypothetical protein
MWATQGATTGAAAPPLTGAHLVRGAVEDVLPTILQSTCQAGRDPATVGELRLTAAGLSGKVAARPASGVTTTVPGAWGSPIRACRSACLPSIHRGSRSAAELSLEA